MEEGKTKKKRRYWLYALILWLSTAIGGSALALVILSAANGSFGPLPTFEQLENPKSDLASEVYSADGVLLGKYYYIDRSFASYDELSEHLIHALIATEDIRFTNHSGIDFRGLMRVLWKTVILRRDQGGGSTITQQLAKNLFHDKPKSSIARIKQKLKEWIIAVRIERRYTKEEIIKMYLNTVPFGEQSFGIKTATRTFFDTIPDSLNLEQSAVLIAMLKATTLYNPVRNPENSKQRRNLIINQVRIYGKITQEECDSIQALPTVLNYHKLDHVRGLAPYFREHLRIELRDYFKNNLKADGSSYNIYSDGLKIYTTLDSRMQEYAEEAVNEHFISLQKLFFDHWNGKDPWGKKDNLIKRGFVQSPRYKILKQRNMSEDSIHIIFHQPVAMKIFTFNGERDTLMSPWDSIKYHKQILQTGFMAMDPKTGHIKAWVGGVNYKYFQYDHVNQNSKRQVGSTFKPFVYAVAMSNDWSPCFSVPDAPVTFEKGEYGLQRPWTPKNATGVYTMEMINLKMGLAKSINSVTAYLMKQFGPQPVIDLCRQVGITSHIDPYPAICLGTPDLSVIELVGAYSTFSNQGVFTKPMYLIRIEDKNGNIIKEYETVKVEALNDQHAYLVTTLLRNVVDMAGGTSHRLRFRYNIPYSLEIGGKTGTTQDHADGWFIGFTPQLVAGTWVGWETRNIHFRNLYYGQGANMALPIWGLFMNKCLNDKSLNYTRSARFEKPLQPLTVEIDCDDYRDNTSPTLDFSDEL
ncbi:MAG: transglycosylase domain-containing protein [Bacteroidetes bacterium]|nr:transglycosylase domain-containing protein [Bacteroidota bacterium]